MDIKITRGKRNSNVTYGELVAAEFKCKTLELAFRGNKKNVSCIPAGVYNYTVLKRSSKIKYPHIWITNVIFRDGIKIHVANYIRQLRGCIAVGGYFADINNDGVLDIVDSRNTLKELIKVIPERGKIEIK